MTLPPVLYWSASLADQMNAREGEDARHGLIDLTVATVPTHWVDFDGWCVLNRVPDDAVRLVLEQVAS